MPKVEHGRTVEGLRVGLSGLELAKMEKLAEINAAFDVATGQITATYPKNELLTFDQQTAEARAFQADSDAECPMLRPLAKARGMEMDELCRRVLAKAAAFSASVGRLMGQRQALEDRLDACTSEAEARALPVAFSLVDGA